MKTEFEVRKVVEEANRQIELKINGEFIDIVDCGTECVKIYLGNSRNNIDKKEGRNRLSFKDWCKENNKNHAQVYTILKDGKNEDDDTETPLGWLTKEEDSTYFKITAKGMNDIYGACENIISPIMTIIDGSVYIDETHPCFEQFIHQIKTHPSYEKIGPYNEKLKGRKMSFSKNEEKLAEELGIKLGVDKIEDKSKG